MVEGRSRRRSGQQPKSYRFEEVYGFLSDSDSRASEDQEQEEQEEEKEKDGDEFVPPGEEEEDEDEDADMQSDDEESSNDEAAAVEEETPRGESIFAVDSDKELEVSTPKPARAAKGKQPATTPSALGRGFGPGNMQAPSRFAKSTGTNMRQRGVEEWGTGGQRMRWNDLFGPTNQDMLPVFRTRDQWISQETFPSRSQGSLTRSFFLSEEAREKEIKTTQQWYANVGREVFNTGRITQELSEEEGRQYMTDAGPESMDLLMGDITKPQLHTLKKGERMSVATPFGSDNTRRGWIINLGTRIQEAQWVANEQSRTQYLAVAIEQKNTSGRKFRPLENPKAPAFTATKPFPASIQIWAFESLETGQLDPAKSPRLEQVICTDWGAPKSFRWCPVDADGSVDATEDGHIFQLGLLAGIWSDGKLRILDVSQRKLGGEQHRTQYIYYSRAAFEVAIPDTIPTCLHWLSGTSLAAGTTSGHLAVWTLSRPGMFPNAPSSSESFTPRPWFYKQVADTYILTLSSGYPSRPQYISITTADGFARLIDLCSPTQDACSSVRGRMLILTQAWHEQTQSFVSPDEHYMLKHNSLRRFYANIYTMRIESSITCCATSPVQPCILIGGSDGIVVASNTTAKVLNQKEIPWQQPWFKHEWRPPVEHLTLSGRDAGQTEKNTANGNIDPALTVTINSAIALPGASSGTLGLPAPDNVQSKVETSALSRPLTRITEGYKAHQVGMQYPDSTKRYKDGAKYLTIFEDKSAISKLAWNPNLKFGTWAAAGTNSGLLRVEDLGV